MLLFFQVRDLPLQIPPGFLEVFETGFLSVAKDVLNHVAGAESEVEVLDNTHDIIALVMCGIYRIVTQAWEIMNEPLELSTEKIVNRGEQVSVDLPRGL